MNFHNLALKDPKWGDYAVDAIRDISVRCREEIVNCIKTGAKPMQAWSELGKKGLIGVITPEQYGGYGGGVPEYCLVVESMARYNVPSSQAQVQGQIWLLVFGTEEQKRKYLPGMSDGTIVFSESISEPGVGSSLKEMKTTARRDGDGWVINGMKTHINAGAFSHVTVVFAATDEGMTAFLVDTNLPGFHAVETDPIGYRLGLTADMYFDNVRVSDDAVLGGVGGAFNTFLTTFNLSRLGNASELIGHARRALDQAIRYARERKIKDNVVTDFQGIQWTIADCYAGLYGASLARNFAANMAKPGVDHVLESTLAKKLAIDAAEKTVNEVFALVGGYGLYWDQDFAQILLDVKSARVAGGSLEILRNHAAKVILKDEDGLRGLA
jgi:alkylation response protein AidB-like acyl-CoA dehydrogenase